MADNGGEAYDPKKDPKRRAKSKDPGWKYAYWPTEDKNVVECLLCGKILSSGIKRMKQHLLGGYGDVLVCEKTTTEIKKEMQAWIDKKRRKMPVEVDDLTWDQVDAAATTSSSLLRRNQPRGGNFYTRRAPQNVDELDQDPFICDDEDVDDDVVGADGTQSQPDGGEDNEADGENSGALEYDDDDV